MNDRFKLRVQLIDATLYFKPKRWSVGKEIQTANLLHRSPKNLDVGPLAEREEIPRGLAKQLSMCAIATQLGRSPSTVSREIHRNGGLLLHVSTSRILCSSRNQNR